MYEHGDEHLPSTRLRDSEPKIEGSRYAQDTPPGKLEHAPFSVGDKVQTDYFEKFVDVVRTVTNLERSEHTQSGWSAKADDGGMRKARELPFIDVGWFNLVERVER
jgi:hypothetical protein